LSEGRVYAGVWVVGNRDAGGWFNLPPAYRTDRVIPGEFHIATLPPLELRLSVDGSAHPQWVLSVPFPLRFLLAREPHVVLEAMDFVARLAALVPRPRVNLTRYHGVLVPNHRWRAEVTPAGRGRWKKGGGASDERSAPAASRSDDLGAALEARFNIDVESCMRCGAAVRVIASIEEPALIERILEHVHRKGEKAAKGTCVRSDGREAGGR